MALALLSIMTISIEASQKGKPAAPSQPKPKYVIPSKPGPINFVTPGPGEKTHPRGHRR